MGSRDDGVDEEGDRRRRWSVVKRGRRKVVAWTMCWMWGLGFEEESLRLWGLEGGGWDFEGAGAGGRGAILRFLILAKMGGSCVSRSRNVWR